MGYKASYTSTNAVQCYLGMRENLVDANTKEFIITYGKPHKPASSSTISMTS